MNISIVDFTHNHIPEASAIALACYNEERQFIPVLPRFDCVPDLTVFAGNHLGVGAFDGTAMVGFLCFYSPWENVFTTKAKGTFSPIHAHGTISENREFIYKRLYQAAADKLVRLGVSSHTLVEY